MDELDSSVFQYLSDNGYRKGHKKFKNTKIISYVYEKKVNVPKI